MIRRAFRIGLWLGLLAGAAFAIAKIFRPKPGPSPVLDLGTPGGSLAPSPSAWPPLEAAVATPTPVQIPEPDVEPVVAAAEPGLVVVGDEPLQEAVPMPDPDHPIPDPVPEPAKKAAPKKKVPAWVDPKGTVCPKSHPVKAKLSSRIFQVPGNFAYERTTPDRCYKSAHAAEADGMRAAKR